MLFYLELLLKISFFTYTFTPISWYIGFEEYQQSLKIPDLKN